jgi:peptidase M28-like protein
MPAAVRLTRLAALGLAWTATLAAQAPRPLKAAAETITPEDLSRRLHVIADDSMQGRDTPSPGLDKTAQYVADQFRKFGLKPGGENGTWFQKYSISQRKLDLAGSHVGFMAGSAHAHADLNRDARLVFGNVPAPGTGGPAVVLGGPLDPHVADGLDLKGKVALVVVDYTKPVSQSLQPTILALRKTGALGVVILSNRDSAVFAQRVRLQPQLRTSVGEEAAGSPILEVHERAVTEALAAAQVDPARFRAATALLKQEAPGLTIMLDLKEDVLDQAWAPNTIGILEGSDPKLKNEYLVFSAHMDHVGRAPSQGCQARGADSICNGADDDGSGTVSVIELAQAFSQRGVRPKRSMLFITVSGEEKNLWGSGYFTSHPTVPLAQVVADLNIDMIGRNWRDTIVAIGKEHSDLGTTLNRVGAQHPELSMAPIDDRWPEENFYSRSDHYNFARKGVPILFFFSGVHDDYHQVSDSPEKIDYEKMSRIVKLLFYLGQDVGNNPERPQWNPASRAKIVETT